MLVKSHNLGRAHVLRGAGPVLAPWICRCQLLADNFVRQLITRRWLIPHLTQMSPRTRSHARPRTVVRPPARRRARSTRPLRSFRTARTASASSTSLHPSGVTAPGAPTTRPPYRSLSLDIGAGPVVGRSPHARSPRPTGCISPTVSKRSPSCRSPVPESAR